MPELPEVQTIVDDLNAAGLPGRRIAGARVFWPRTVAGLSVRAFCRRAANQRIAAIGRRGKFIVVTFDGGGCLLIHLRMSGRLTIAAAGDPRTKHEHVVLTLEDGRQLRFHDPRKFGRMYLVSNPAAVLEKLGPEPLDPGFSVKSLAAALEKRRRMLKPLLLDQHFIAGLGNIYVDEALWAARLHPCRLAASLTTDEIRALHRAIPGVLNTALRNLGTSLGSGDTNFYSVAGRPGRNRDKLMVFRRTGRPCPRCRAPIERIVVGQRSTHVCPACQKI